MKKWLNIMAIGTICSMIALFACKKDKDDPNTNTGNSYNRGAMLTNYADGYIVPAYTRMSENLAVLKSKVDDFAAAPALDKLADLQASWRESYLLWQRVEMLEFGPDESTALRMYFNIYPVSPSKINNNIASGTYNLEQFGNTDAQGFPAMDYLLNGLATTNNDILDYYTSDPQATNRKQYLQAVTAKMLEKINVVRAAWTTGGYRTPSLVRPLQTLVVACR